MQTQDAPAEILFKLWPWLEANKNRLIGLAVALLVITGVFYFISSQKEQKVVDAGLAMSSAIMNPPAGGNASQMAAGFEDVAGKYAGTPAAERAQLQAAAEFFNEGNFPDAQAQFQKYLDGNSTGPLAATAEFGIAACLEAQNKLDDAAAAYQRVLTIFPDSTCDAPAELGLGRVTEQQGKLNEALTHYEKASQSPLGGSIVQEAMIHGSEVKARLAAAAPKPAATATSAPAFKGMSLTQPASQP